MNGDFHPMDRIAFSSFRIFLGTNFAVGMHNMVGRVQLEVGTANEKGNGK